MRYRNPGKGQSVEDGFDCSGFVKFVLSRSNIYLPGHIRHANEFFDQFGVLVHWGFHRIGDLVFFSRNGVIPTHIGIVVSQETFIHSPGKDGQSIELSDLMQTPIANLSHEKIYGFNPIGFKRIAILEGRWHKFMKLISSSQ